MFEIMSFPIKFFRVVSSLPQETEPNSLYFVRVGTGFDFYITDLNNVPIRLNTLHDPNEILFRLSTVDGSNSGLDADFLDGLDSNAFAQKSLDEEITGFWKFEKAWFNDFIAIGTLHSQSGALRLANDAWITARSADGLSDVNLFKLNPFNKIEAGAPIIGELEGNASTANALKVPRTISFSGDVSGSFSFDGSSNISVSLSLSPTGVSSGTYTKVSVDDRGRVVSGSFLTSSDIPHHAHSANDITVGRFSFSRLPTSAHGNRVLAVTAANSDPVFTQINSDMIADGAVSNSKIGVNNSLIPNLNADLLDGYHASLTSSPFSIPVSDAFGKIPSNFLPFASRNSAGIIGPLYGDRVYFLNGTGGFSKAVVGGEGATVAALMVPSMMVSVHRNVPYALSSYATTVFTFTPNVIYLIPFVFNVDGRIRSIGIYVEVPGNGSLQVGVYYGLSVFPFEGRNLLTSASLNLNTTGQVVYYYLNEPNFQYGVYWVALLANVSATVRAVPSSALRNLGTLFSETSSVVAYTLSNTSLPNTLPLFGYDRLFNSPLPAIIFEYNVPL